MRPTFATRPVASGTAFSFWPNCSAATSARCAPTCALSACSCPVTAVVTNDVAPDVAVVAQECDFTAENWYGESMIGRSADARPALLLQPQHAARRQPGRIRAVYGQPALEEQARRDPRMGHDLAKPSRAVSVPEALAYASLQDYDAVLLFGYQTNRAPNGAQRTRSTTLRFRPTPRHGDLHALAGQAFLSRAIKPADHVAYLSYTPDRLYALAE